MITLPKVVDGGKKDLVLVTDLLDGEEYPAAICWPCMPSGGESKICFSRSRRFLAWRA